MNPELWGKVASQIGTGATTTAAATGMSLTTKLIIGVGAASVITAGTIIAVNSGEEEKKPETQIAQTEITDPKTEDKTIEIKDDSQETNPETSTQEVNYVYTPEPEPTPTPDPEPVLYVVPTPGPITEPGTSTPLEPATIGSIENVEVVSGEPSTIPIDPIEDPIDTAEPSEPAELEYKEIEISFPNVFTPNGDRINDYLFIKNSEELDEDEFSIVVIDDHNKEVYASSNPNFKWNGYSERRGEMLSAGNYIAIITCKDKYGRQMKPVMKPFTIVK